MAARGALWGLVGSWFSSYLSALVKLESFLANTFWTVVFVSVTSESLYGMRPENKKETKTINQNFVVRKQISFSFMLLYKDLTKYRTCITTHFRSSSP